MINDVQAVPTELKQPLIDCLLSLADDEFVLGYWDSEWTGVAPMLEEDVATSSIAQDEIGHARLLYELASALTDQSADQLAYGRTIEQYRQSQLAERQRGDWAFTIARQFFYDTADGLRVEHLCSSTYQPLAEAMHKIQHEEVYHHMHVHAWLERLATGTSEARRRLTDALQTLWPDALGFFEPLPGESLLLNAGILTSTSAQLQQRWLTTIAPTFARLDLPFPLEEQTNAGETLYRPTITARLGGRSGQHTHDFALLWEQITRVYRLDPQATW
jgi:ring-1,2-phenylacetyl-CoA epoxidase subunit PaaC